MVLAEKEIPFEVVVVDKANKDHKTPEYLAKHPFGEVPLIVDDGFILFESRAICRYLAEKYADQGTPLIPTGLRERALFEQAASIEFANFFPQIVKVAGQTVYKQLQGLPIDEAALAQAKSDLAAKLDVYEVILGKQKFLGGNELTLADLFHVSYAGPLAKAGFDVMADKGPNVTRWWNEIVSRPTWVKLQEEGIKSVGI
ncbi:glutathione S-transferase [Mycena rosella]|uniref:glutathione transferase n=1 Tax=Mycena rosella TaxID=1033263 RepID=A0AAD7CP75_MYCRO|nr:glutathione S-transferase [Mycena rosella]